MCNIDVNGFYLKYIFKSFVEGKKKLFFMSYKSWFTDVRHKLCKVEMHFALATWYVKQNLQDGNLGYQ